MKKSKSLFLITILVYIFLVGPLLVIVAASFSDTTYLKFPGEGFTLRWYEQILKIKSFKAATGYSLLIAFVSTIFALIMGLPAAYALNRYRFKGKAVIQNLFLSPVLIPVIVLGFVMLRYVVNRLRLPALPSLLIGDHGGVANQSVQFPQTLGKTFKGIQHSPWFILSDSIMVRRLI